jgi:hypothetical protein
MLNYFHFLQSDVIWKVLQITEIGVSEPLPAGIELIEQPPPPIRYSGQHTALYGLPCGLIGPVFLALAAHGPVPWGPGLIGVRGLRS